MSTSLTRSPGLDPIPLESPLSLFGPPHYVQGQIPAPLLLLEYVPGKLDKNYDSDEQGFLRDRGDYYLEHVLDYEDGSRCRIEVTAHPKLGLPTAYDWDFLLGLFRIADQGGVDPDTGRILDPSYRGAVRAAARSETGQEAVNAAKRAFARWGGVIVKTWTDISYTDEVARVREQGGYPVAPTGYPPRREIESSHHVLSYDVERYLRGDEERDFIGELRIDPVWLGQTVAGISAWIDVDVHSGLRSPTAKAIYQRMAVRIARGQRQGYVVTVPELLAKIGKKPSIRASTDLAEIRRALEALEEAEILGPHEHRRIRRGLYEVTIVPGPKLHTAGLLRGAGATDAVQTRRLLFHLGRFNISVAAARELIRSNPSQVASALSRAYYLKLERGGFEGKARIGNFAGWIVQAVRNEWVFDEPEYLAWVEQMRKFALNGPEASAPVVVRPEPSAAGTVDPPQIPEAPPEPLPDDAWGRAREAIREQLAGPIFDAWLRPTWLVAITESTVCIGTDNRLAPTWITDRCGGELTAALSEDLGRPVRLVFRTEAPSSAGLRAKPAEDSPDR